MLDKFEVMIARQLSENNLLSDARHHLFNSKTAKHARPKFIFACGQLLGVPESKLLKIACAVELIHTASLLHDDVVDNATKRRGLPSVNAKFGNNTALLAGDQLLARALLILSDSPQSQKSIKAAAKTLLKMSNAVALEDSLRDKNPGTYEQILSIADGKTGALFALCGSLVGFAVDDNMAAKKLSNAGNLIGRIFQINDDIDDAIEDKKDSTQTIPQIFGISMAEDETNSSFSKMLKIIKFYENNKNFANFKEVIYKLTSKQNMDFIYQESSLSRKR